jgi:hypothetical protein
VQSRFIEGLYVLDLKCLNTNNFLMSNYNSVFISVFSHVKGCNCKDSHQRLKVFSVYFGYDNEINCVSNVFWPLWVLKTVKEKYVQRLVHMSADLARQVSVMLEDLQNSIADEVCFYTILCKCFVWIDFYLSSASNPWLCWIQC